MRLRMPPSYLGTRPCDYACPCQGCPVIRMRGLNGLPIWSFDAHYAMIQPRIRPQGCPVIRGAQSVGGSCHGFFHLQPQRLSH